jgi:hypothetical protein
VQNAADELHENCMMDFAIDAVNATEVAASIGSAAVAANNMINYQAPEPALSPAALTAIIAVSVVLGVAILSVIGLVRSHHPFIIHRSLIHILLRLF